MKSSYNGIYEKGRSNLYHLPKLSNQNKAFKQKTNLNKEFAEVNFKQVVWRESSIMCNELYNLIMDEIPKERIMDEQSENNFRRKFENIRIKSRIGELSRKHERKYRNMTAVSTSRRESPRISTPWTFTGNKTESIFYPK